jgi:hypothetical protein
LCLAVHDALDDAEKIKGAAAQSVNALIVTTSSCARTWSNLGSLRRSLCVPVTFSR